MSHDREIADNRKPWDAWTPIHTAGDFYRAARFRDEKRILDWPAPFLTPLGQGR